MRQGTIIRIIPFHRGLVQARALGKSMGSHGRWTGIHCLFLHLVEFWDNAHYLFLVISQCLRFAQCLRFLLALEPVQATTFQAFIRMANNVCVKGLCNYLFIKWNLSDL